MDPELHDRIKGCIAIEQAAASIYGTFSNMFPDEKDFWEDLKNDEVEHSSLLKGVDYLETFSKFRSRTMPPSIPFIQKTYEYALNISSQLRMTSLALEDALRIALQLEESMVETFTNELITDLNADDDSSFMMDFDKILIDEKTHVNKIKNVMIMKGLLKLS